MKYIYLFCIISLILLVGIVAAEPPKISLVVKPIEGSEPLTIQASEESGDPAIIDYQWDFGDGNRAFHEAKIEHTYEKAGEYKLVLTVINGKGEETFDSITIFVIEPEITPEPTPIQDIIEIPQRIVYEGATPIKDALAAKTATKSTTTILSEETAKALKDVKYPYDISSSKVEGTKTIVTIFKIQKYRCEEICGYWIEATRDGQEVFTDSPVWISPPPYEIVVSGYYDSIAKENIITIKEDPKQAVELVLQRYVEMQPLGKAVSYER